MEYCSLLRRFRVKNFTFWRSYLNGTSAKFLKWAKTDIWLYKTFKLQIETNRPMDCPQIFCPLNPVLIQSSPLFSDYRFLPSYPPPYPLKANFLRKLLRCTSLYYQQRSIYLPNWNINFLMLFDLTFLNFTIMKMMNFTSQPINICHTTLLIMQNFFDNL